MREAGMKRLTLKRRAENALRKHEPLLVGATNSSFEALITQPFPRAIFLAQQQSRHFSSVIDLDDPNMPSNMEIMPGNWVLRFWDVLVGYRLALSLACPLLNGLNYLVILKCKCWSANLLPPSLLPFLQMIVGPMESGLFYSVLGWRGGKGSIVWVLPVVELMQLLATVGLYALAFSILDPQDERVDMNKFRISSTSLLVISIFGFLWTTGVFCYFHLFRMSGVPPGYEPITCSSESSENDSEDSTGGGGAIMEAYQRQFTSGYNPRLEYAGYSPNGREVSSHNLFGQIC